MEAISPWEGLNPTDRMRAFLNLPIILLISREDEQKIESIQAVRPFGYLFKPFRDIEFKVCIETALNRIALEYKLRRSERHFRSFVENAQDIIYSLSLDGVFLYISPNWSDVLGHERSELIGQPFTHLVHPDDIHQYKAFIEKAIATGDQQPAVECRVKHKSGAWKWYVIHASPLKDEEGNLFSLMGLAHDITDRKSAADELRRLNRALRAIIECHQALVRATEESELLNKICQVIVETGGYRLAWVGLARDDAEKSVQSVASTGYEDGYLETIRITWANTEYGRGPTGTAIRTGKPVINRNVLVNPDFAPWSAEATKRGYASSVALPIHLDQKVIGALNIYAAEADAFDEEEVALLMRLTNDLAYGIQALRARSEHRIAQESLKESAEKLKLFSYSVSHDLKSPAMAIHRLTQKMKTSYQDIFDDQGRRYCDQILKASEQVVALVDQINLYIATKELPLNIETVDVGNMTRMLKEEFSSELQMRKIRWLETEYLPEIQADRLCLFRIFRNLVDNALKYGGRDLSRIEIGYESADQYHIFFVSDDGVGIKLEDSGELFIMFKRYATSKGVQGAGLGLAIVKEIVEKHGGRVWMQTDPNQGATFYFSISKHLSLQRRDLNDLQPSVDVKP